MGLLLVPFFIPLAAHISRIGISRMQIEPPNFWGLVVATLFSYLGSALLAAVVIFVVTPPGLAPPPLIHLGFSRNTATAISEAISNGFVFVSWIAVHSLVLKLVFFVRHSEVQISWWQSIVLSLYSAPLYWAVILLSIIAPGT